MLSGSKTGKLKRAKKIWLAFCVAMTLDFGMDMSHSILKVHWNEICSKTGGFCGLNFSRDKFSAFNFWWVSLKNHPEKFWWKFLICHQNLSRATPPRYVGDLTMTRPPNAMECHKMQSKDGKFSSWLCTSFINARDHCYAFCPLSAPYQCHICAMNEKERHAFVRMLTFRTLTEECWLASIWAMVFFCMLI